MGRTAIVIAATYGAVVILGVIIAIGVATSTRRRGEVDTHKLAERETRWLVFVVAFLLALLVATMFAIPYGKSTPKDAQIVNVTALQFAWEIAPATVRAGTPVAFKLRSRDVNHGFGVYDAKGTFLFQVQVVPGKTTTIVHTFARPGVYQILCLEFCGVDHHLMKGQFTVA